MGFFHSTKGFNWTKIKKRAARKNSTARRPKQPTPISTDDDKIFISTSDLDRPTPSHQEPPHLQNGAI